MEGRSILQEGNEYQQHDMNSNQREENCAKEDELEKVEDKCTNEEEVKPLTRKMQRKLRKQEAKKRKQEMKLKRKLEMEEDNGESIPRKKQKKSDAEKNQKASHKPSITLTLRNHFCKTKHNDRLYLKLKDIQDLILYSLLWQSTGTCPQWCQLQHRKKINKVIVIALKSLGESDYLQNTDAFPYISKEFNQHVVQTVAPGTDFSFQHPHESLLNVPLSKNQIKKELEKSLNGIKEQGPDQIKYRYLLDEKQMKSNDYPSKCYSNDNGDNDDGFVPCVVNEAKESTENNSPVFAIDCEMCNTSAGQELTRISMVDESFQIVYDSLVMPDRPILDYKTKYSGITAKLLQGVTVKLQDVQKEVQRILPHNAILAGHSLNFDLQALKMYHNRMIDTSVIFGDKRGAHFKPSLKYLAHSLLSKNIQKNSTGHCSIEDAKTVMELVKRKFEAGPSFGQTETPTEGLFDRIDREERKNCKKLVSAMVDYPAIVKFYQSAGNHAVSRVSDSEIVSSAVKLINTSDFVWLHLHAVQHFYDGMARDDANVKKEVFKTLDERVSTICQAIPENSLAVIIMGCGDVTEVLRIRRDPEPRNEELRRAVAEAKKGLCFLRIT